MVTRGRSYFLIRRSVFLCFLSIRSKTIKVDDLFLERRL